MLAVSPSHGRVYGLRYVAIRVFPSGKLSRGPSEIQLRGSFLSAKLEKTNPTKGIASSTPAATFTATPAANSQSRRVGGLLSFTFSGSLLGPCITHSLPTLPLIFCLTLGT